MLKKGVASTSLFDISELRKEKLKRKDTLISFGLVEK